jgi:2-phosphosulfolactate phosphatase
MEKRIKIFWPWEIPSKADGIFVVADVYAATTNIASFLTRGAKNLLVVNKDSIFETRKKFNDAVVIGEGLADVPIGFFDATNVPWDNFDIKVKGKTIIYMTNNGTKVIEELFNRGAKIISAVSFANISKVADWLKKNIDSEINLIPAGEGSFKDKRAYEDLACVEALRDLLLGRKVPFQVTFKKIKKYICENYHSADFDTDFKIILKRDRYPVLPFCKREKEGLIRIESGKI